LTLAIQTKETVTQTQARVHARMTGRAPELSTLTGLRFVAALWVVLYHIVIMTGQEHAPLLIQRGYAGVSFFFVLSGFILTYAYSTAHGHLRGSRRAFWVARFARIYPVYAVAFLVAAIPTVWSLRAGAPQLLPAAVAALTLTQAWFPSLAIVWNGPGWSLSAETVFYALFPAMLPRLSRLNQRQLLIALGMCWAFSLVIPTLAVSLGTVDAPALPEYLVKYNPLVRLPEFVMGMALARLWLCRQGTQGTMLIPRRAAGCPIPVALASVLGLVLAFSSGPTLPQLLVHDGLWDPLFALVVYSAASAPQQRVPAWVAVAGESSYAMYLLHLPLWVWLTHTIWFGLVLTVPLAASAYITLAFAVSVVTLYGIEQPARRYLHALLA